MRLRANQYGRLASSARNLASHVHDVPVQETHDYAAFFLFPTGKPGETWKNVPIFTMVSVANTCDDLIVSRQTAGHVFSKPR
ncbi:MAG TPA: hypothetical protein DEB39_08160 [Planctomycetaceae bacterium]|nr:hypothetical protein [Planctomycetaceae bacterium]